MTTPNSRATFLEKSIATEYRRQRAIRPSANEAETLAAVESQSVDVRARAATEVLDHARLAYTMLAGSLVAYDWNTFAGQLDVNRLIELRPDQLRREVAEIYRRWRKSGERRT